MKNKIGGFFGIKSTKFSAKIIFPRKEYFFGQRAMIRVEFDNSKCKKDLKNMKIKLVRRYAAQGKSESGFRSSTSANRYDVCDFTM